MIKRQLAASMLGNEIARHVWRRNPRPGLRILAYHRVLDDDESSFPFDQEVISATTDGFFRQMKFVRDNFEVISFRELEICEERQRAWPKRGLIITFDDGYRDNYTNAFPILKELGLTATIFLTAGHIGSRELFWWDLVAYCVKHSARASLNVPQIAPQPMRLTSGDARNAAIRDILRWLKIISENCKRTFVSQLAELTGVTPPNQTEPMHLNWTEVSEMANFGFEFGSHTLTHPILTNVSEEQLVAEVGQAKTMIEQRLKQKIIAFSYPVGRFDERVQTAVSNQGFQFAVAYKDEAAYQASFERYQLPRIHVERKQSLSEFRSVLLFPALMSRSGWLQASRLGNFCKTDPHVA
jgi:peptidoglycan/xylan/chitin deacetylase (PgdA/CDA1 family)